jgi:hypothetical protein
LARSWFDQPALDKSFDEAGMHVRACSEFLERQQIAGRPVKDNFVSL